jgi:hypothetical protein
MWITAIEFEIENAPAVTLHHATLFRLDRFDRQCPEDQGERIISFSQDQMHSSQVIFPEGYAVFIPKGAPLVLHAMFHNPAPPLGPGDTYKDVSVQVHFRLASLSTELRPLEFHLLRLSNTPCVQDDTDSAHVFVVPPLTMAYHFFGTGAPDDSSKYTATRSSKIVYWGAHLHGWEGGKELLVRKNGETIETFATYKATDDAYRYDTPHAPVSIPLEVGDVVSIEAIYDNSTSEPLRGAMGEFGVYVAEE